MSGRRGFSLLEILVVMAGMSMVLGVCISLIYGLLRMERSGRAILAEGQVTARMARDFRRDLRAAQSVDLGSVASGQARQAVLRLPGKRTVEYRAEKRQVIRTVSEENEIRGREVYRLNRSGRAHFDREKGSTSTIVRLVVDSAPGSAGSGTEASCVIEAILGRDARFLKETE